MFNRGLRGIVPLDEVLVVFGRAFVLRAGLTTFDTTVKALKVLHRGIGQSSDGGCVPPWGHEEDRSSLRWERAFLTKEHFQS